MGNCQQGRSWKALGRLWSTQVAGMNQAMLLIFKAESDFLRPFPLSIPYHYLNRFYCREKRCKWSGPRCESFSYLNIESSRTQVEVDVEQSQVEQQVERRRGATTIWIAKESSRKQFIKRNKRRGSACKFESFFGCDKLPNQAFVDSLPDVHGVVEMAGLSRHLLCYFLNNRRIDGVWHKRNRPPCQSRLILQYFIQDFEDGGGSWEQGGTWLHSD